VNGYPAGDDDNAPLNNDEDLECRARLYGLEIIQSGELHLLPQFAAVMLREDLPLDHLLDV